MTSNITKTLLSPVNIMVVGWPNRQNTTSMTIYFRIFVAYLVVNDCASGTYYDSVSSSCLPCVSPCITCTNATACSWCIPGYYYNAATMTCLVQTQSFSCPAGTYKDPVLALCRACSPFCAACTSYTTCTQCVTAQYTIANGQCFAPMACPSGFRYDTALGC